MRTILLVAAAAALLTAGCDRQGAGQSQAPAGITEASRRGGLGLDRSQAGTATPDVAFRNAEGKEVRLSDYAGRPVLVNLWATWCAPCVKELPTLDALADRPGAPLVMALSQDMAELGKVRSFLAERNIALDAYQDRQMDMSSALRVTILPTTILYGADGKEVWRFTGDLDWSGAPAATLLAEAR